MEEALNKELQRVKLSSVKLVSFATAINTLLQSDAALNAALYDSDREETRIYAYHLPDNLGIDKSAIVFTYKKDEGIDTLEAKNVLENIRCTWSSYQEIP